MKHSVKHDLGRDKAKEVAIAAYDSYRQRFEKYNPQATWKSDYSAEISFTAKGINLTGSMDVNEKDIAMDLDVPFLLRPFKNTALGVIEEEIKRWIEKAKAGEI